MIRKDRPLKMNRGCQICAGEALSKISIQAATKNLLDGHTILGSESRKTEQKDGRTSRYYKIACPENHQYWKTTSEINKGCPECNKTVFLGQERVRIIFEDMYKQPFEMVRPDWLKNAATGKNLELDGYCESLKIAFEFHGRQHYTNKTQFGDAFGNELKAQQARDLMKKELCARLGVKIFEIPQPISYERNQFIEDVIESCKKQNLELIINKGEIMEKFGQITNSTVEKNYQNFKRKVESYGYSLLSKHFITSKETMEFQCGEGHQFSMTGELFMQKFGSAYKFNGKVGEDKKKQHACRVCEINNNQDVRTQYDVETCGKMVEGIGWKLNSKKYLTVHTEMSWTCDQKHEVIASVRSLKRKLEDKTRKWPICDTCKVLEMQSLTGLNKIKKEVAMSCIDTNTEINSVSLRKLTDGKWLSLDVNAKKEIALCAEVSELDFKNGFKDESWKVRLAFWTAATTSNVKVSKEQFEAGVKDNNPMIQYIVANHPDFLPFKDLKDWVNSEENKNEELKKFFKENMIVWAERIINQSNVLENGNYIVARKGLRMR